MKKRAQNVAGGINMTPMIDVVFQMIIFFVCTAQLEREQFSELIHLPSAAHAPELAGERDPRTITIELDAEGRVAIARTRLSITKLGKILSKVVLDYGVHGPSIPIQIRADSTTPHQFIRRVLDECTSAGLYKISFVVLKDSLEESHES